MSANPPVYNHRPMQPSGVRVNPPPGAGPSNAPFSLNDSLDAIRNGYESLQTELNSIRSQRDELEMKLEAQVDELANVRRSLFELERSQSRVRLEYEDEITRLRAEVMAARSLGVPQGIPGHSPRALGGPGGGSPHAFHSASTSTSMADAHQQHQQRNYSTRTTTTTRDRDRLPVGRESSLSSLDRDGRPKLVGAGGPREDGGLLLQQQLDSDRDTDRLSDRRDPKRHKARGEPLDSYPSPIGHHPGLGPSVKPLASQQQQQQPAFSNPSGIHRVASGPSAHALPPMNANAPGPDIDELSIHTVPPEFKKEGNDWCAVYNPKVKKALDVNLLHTFNHSSVVCCVQFSADGRLVATGCNRTAQIFDVHTGKKLCVVEDETAPPLGDLYIRSVRFSPDGKLLATGAEDRKIRVWDIETRRILHVFDGHQQEIYSLDFSRDGRYIVSGSGDKTMRIWSIGTQSCRTLTISEADALNEDAGVTSVAISPDGRLVAAGSLDAVVRVWDIVTGALLERLKGHEDSVYSVAFTPDGKGILSGSLDKTLRFWDVSGVVSKIVKQDPASSRGPTPAPPPINMADVPTNSPLLTFVGHKSDRH
ncbi:unnamed protein product [Cyclocybe aegerita]|uniref:Transcriptional repressor Tup1 N-terminal domain-containing protein n=1 Tax=Cyclocybe aegerita TaxID=1973307 RepID=A0A8S0XQ14_CYCAE|nr:unnamed protein product [Cyclocybe aegerita]